MPTTPSLIPRHNLGLYRLEGFVGRTAELDQLAAWLADERVGVVVLSAPAGAGKTSLATVAAWAARDRFPGGLIWVGAAGQEDFRREDIYLALDTVLGTTILIQPPQLRTAAALNALYAEPRLLVLDELERVSHSECPDILAMIRRSKSIPASKVILIAESLPEGCLPTLQPELLTPEPMDATALEEMANTELAPPEAAAVFAGRWPELAQWTGGNPLRARLALGLAARSAAAGADGEALATQLESLRDKPLKAWLEAAQDALRPQEPAAAELLSRLGLGTGNADLTVLTPHYWRDLGTPDVLGTAVTMLVQRGLAIRDGSRILLHPEVRAHLAEQAPLTHDPDRWTRLERALTSHYLSLAEEYGQRPREAWSEIDADWPNIRHFAHLAVDRFEAALGQPLMELTQDDALPSAPLEDAATVEAFALALLPVVLWRHPRASRRWLTAGQLAARMQSHPHRAAQLEAALGGLSYLEEDPDSAVRHFRAAREAFDEMGDLHRLMQTMLELGSVLRALGKRDEAIDTYRDAVALAEQAGDELDRATAYAQLGAAFHAAGEPFRAIEWLDRARPALEASGGPALAALLNNLGLVYEAVGRFGEAITVYQRSFELIEPTTRASQLQLATIAGNIGAAHYELGELEEALSSYRRDLALSQAIGDQAGTAATHHNIGHVLLEMGVPQGALTEFTRAREIYERLGLDELVAEEDEAIAHAHARAATVVH